MIHYENIIERKSVTPRYHGSKISGSQQSFLWATVLLMSAIMQKKVTHVNFFAFFSCHICRTTVCWDPQILLQWQDDVTTTPLSNNIQVQNLHSFDILHLFEAGSV